VNNFGKKTKHPKIITFSPKKYIYLLFQKGLNNFIDPFILFYSLPDFSFPSRLLIPFPTSAVNGSLSPQLTAKELVLFLPFCYKQRGGEPAYSVHTPPLTVHCTFISAVLEGVAFTATLGFLFVSLSTTR
jgi:hypothetical protein